MAYKSRGLQSHGYAMRTTFSVSPSPARLGHTVILTYWWLCDCDKRKTTHYLIAKAILIKQFTIKCLGREHQQKILNIAKSHLWENNNYTIRFVYYKRGEYTLNSDQRWNEQNSVDTDYARICDEIPQARSRSLIGLELKTLSTITVNTVHYITIAYTYCT